MKTDIVQEEPKLILKYPYQAKLNQVAFVAIVAFSLIVIWILKNLIQIGTDESLFDGLLFVSTRSENRS